MREQVLEAAAAVLIDPIDDLRDAVGEDQLLDQPHRENRDAECEAGAARGLGMLELRHQLVRTQDRPGDQMREEQDIAEQDPQRRLQRIFAAVDVDDIGAQCEGDERQPERQRPAQLRGVDRVVQAEHVIGQKERVFDEDQRQEQGEQRRREPQPPAALLLACIDPGGARERDERHREGQPDIDGTPPGIEHRAAGDDQPDPQMRGQKEVTGEVDGKKDEKDRVGKQHYLLDPSSVFAPC